MPIYHLSAKIISRKDGRNAVAAAAYRSATRLTDTASGITHDYRRKRGVEYAEILAPPCAPEWVYDRQKLWNVVERIEKRKDAQLARELELGLPVELPLHQQLELVFDFVTAELVADGMLVDVAIHRNDVQNPHAHLLQSTRRVLRDGFGPKERRWSDIESLLTWRRQWAERVNARLAAVGSARRVDHRSLAAPGIDRTPGRKIGR
jgi:ATP-dependent exoDNAse (exonuclease V) alpha subunit